MIDNTYKKVEDVKKGDFVITYDFHTKKYSVGEIECVVSTICNFMVEHMVSLGNLKITPYHPIIEIENRTMDLSKRFKTIFITLLFQHVYIYCK